MKINGVLFDFDGTLVNSMDYHYAAWKKVFAEYGAQLEAHELFVREGQGVKEVALQLMDIYGIDRNLLDEIYRKKRAYYDAGNNTQVYPGVKQLLEFLTENGIRCGVVTGGDKPRVTGDLKKNGLHHYFKAIVTIEDLEKGKPHPDPYLEGVRQLGLKPDEVLAVENAPLGIESAHRAGLKTFGITTTLGENDLNNADMVFASFDEIRGKIARSKSLNFFSKKT